MIKKLKPFGLHHGLPVFIISWILCFVFTPYVGMAAAIYGAGRYEGREQKEGEMRGLTMQSTMPEFLKKIEWKDFLVVWALAAFNVWIMSGMLQN